MIDLESLTKISRQLDVSMGSMMGLVDGFAVLMFMILIYLLSKIIIEKMHSRFYGQDSRLQQPGDQPVVYRIDIDHGGTVSVAEPSGGILGDGISFGVVESGEHQWMDYVLYRVSGLC